MASSTPNVIALTLNRDHAPLFDAKSAAAIAPGELVEKNSSGLLILHATAGGNAYPWIADYNPFAATNTTPAIDQDWASGDYVRYYRALPGEEFYMWLKAGENASIDSPLESDGAGALKVHTPLSVVESGSATKTVYGRNIVGYSMEAKDNSAGGSAVRIKVMIA